MPSYEGPNITSNLLLKILKEFKNISSATVSGVQPVFNLHSGTLTCTNGQGINHILSPVFIKYYKYPLPTIITTICGSGNFSQK